MIVLGLSDSCPYTKWTITFESRGHSFQLFNRRPSTFIFLCKVSKAIRTQSTATLFEDILTATFQNRRFRFSMRICSNYLAYLLLALQPHLLEKFEIPMLSCC
ncbi:hypothetical protein HMPREF0971_01509 [Segatella oris F0302]|uniref:Uncharacterized protein n=1 Tax=Segatella oris F0302 TaxID=649760 RepID=D1QRA6_9BACT|nr:hypothetical protein HMPREF0971_01509 [Segatella oris F0302]